MPLLADGPAARNETWNKLNADPLLMMRMQEQDARKHVTENPVKMAQIRREVAELRQQKKDKKRAKKEAKKEAKKAKKEAIRDEIRRTILGEEGYATTKQKEGKHRDARRVMTTTLHHLRLEALSATAEDAAGRGQGRGPGSTERAMKI